MFTESWCYKKGDDEWEIHGHLRDRESLTKDAIELHCGKCRSQYFCTVASKITQPLLLNYHIIFFIVLLASPSTCGSAKLNRWSAPLNS